MAFNLYRNAFNIHFVPIHVNALSSPKTNRIQKISLNE
ncbi:hypothetical protein M899_1719 [Bacteriovorax sp. BSW11_IV]|nr:hypothetical protein M899_1719 [Bacteriovorax sp. BSW11_IV]